MDLLKIQRQIVPEIIENLELRYDILKSIYYNQPIGRRSLADKLNLKERTIRSQINILKELELLNIESMGMYISSKGINIVEKLDQVMHELKEVSDLEKTLEEALGLEQVIIVPGNKDEKDMGLDDIGKAGANYLKKIIQDDFIIGITGGTTMASLSKNMPKGSLGKDLLVIPARGGLGKDVETQSNNIAAQLAKNIKGSYELLQIPDNMDQESLDVVVNLPSVKEIIQKISRMDLLVFGIGRADQMAYRRDLPKEKIDEILSKSAVAEAFGHYFDLNGDEVWEHRTVGISLDQFKSLDKLIGIAGGEEKAEAIIAVSRLNKKMTLITDDLAARRIIQLIN